MNWQRYTDRMNAWRALNPGASPDEYEAASLAIERDVAKPSRGLDRRIEKRDATPACLASIPVDSAKWQR